MSFVVQQVCIIKRSFDMVIFHIYPVIDAAKSFPLHPKCYREVFFFSSANMLNFRTSARLTNVTAESFFKRFTLSLLDACSFDKKQFFYTWEVLQLNWVIQVHSVWNFTVIIVQTCSFSVILRSRMSFMLLIIMTMSDKQPRTLWELSDYFTQFQPTSAEVCKPSSHLSLNKYLQC